MNAQFHRFAGVALMWTGVATGHMVVSAYVLGGTVMMSALVLFELWRTLGIDTKAFKDGYLRREASFLSLNGGARED